MISQVELSLKRTIRTALTPVMGAETQSTIAERASLTAERRQTETLKKSGELEQRRANGRLSRARLRIFSHEEQR